jgi:formamidopyrimidine-DNA glycosylase
MPELPEVETVRMGLEPVMAEQLIKLALVNSHALRGGVPVDFSERVTAMRVEALLRRGKYMILTLSSGEAIIWHLGMSGRVRVYAPEENYIAEKHDHIVFDMQGGDRVVFNDPRRFGMMYLVSRDWEMEMPFSKMGAEPLGNGFNGVVLFEALRRKKGPIKGALLDQTVVAGLGNIYVCEALFRAGVHPERRGCDVSVSEAEILAGHIKDVLRDALASGGSSLRDYRKTDGGMGYFQHHFDVYGQEREPCKSCKTPVERIVQSGRSTFFCGVCQK